jgi:hypothetical protein
MCHKIQYKIGELTTNQSKSQNWWTHDKSKGIFNRNITIHVNIIWWWYLTPPTDNWIILSEVKLRNEKAGIKLTHPLIKPEHAFGVKPAMILAEIPN